MRLKIVAKFKEKEYNNMSKVEKEIERLKSKPKDFMYDELRRLLNKLGFIEHNRGKTSGSGVKFIDNNKRIIELHKPHPSNVIKTYKINEILKQLKEWRLI